MRKNIKWTIEMVKNEVESHQGFILLSKEYKTKKSKMDFICPVGHPFTTSFDSFTNSTHKCIKCGHAATKAKQSMHIQEIINAFVEEKYTIIDGLDLYENSDSKLKVKCQNGHAYTTKISNFIHGKRRCKKCKKHTTEEVQKIFVDKGYIPLFDEYLGCKQYLPYLCRKHSEQIQYVVYSSLTRKNNNSKNCQSCFKESVGEQNHSQWQGGISRISFYLRGFIDEWKMKHLKEAGYKCDITCETEELEVHHLYSFSQLVKEIHKTLGLKIRKIVAEYDHHELQMLSTEIAKIHNEHSGIPLSKSIHQLFHKIYGKNKNTPEQYYEFKNRYFNGEFDISVSV